MKVFMSFAGVPIKVAEYLRDNGIQSDGKPPFMSKLICVDITNKTVSSIHETDQPLTTLAELKEIMRPWLEKQLAARTKQLTQLGYCDRGGEYMAPPLGKTPDYILEEMDMKSTYYYVNIAPPTTENIVTKFLYRSGFKQLPNSGDPRGSTNSVKIYPEDKTFQMIPFPCGPGDSLLTFDELKALIAPPTTLEQALEAYKAGRTVNVAFVGDGDYSHLNPDTPLKTLLDPKVTFQIEKCKTEAAVRVLSGVKHTLENGQNIPDDVLLAALNTGIDEITRLAALTEN